MSFTLTLPGHRAERLGERGAVRLPYWERTSEPEDVLRFLDTLVRAERIEHASGYIDHAAELAVRALVVAAAMWPFHGRTAVHGVREVLADQLSIYDNTARSWRTPSSTVMSAEARAARAEVPEAAAARVAAMLRAVETEFAAAL